MLSGENLLLLRLREEKAHRLSGGIYHELQVRMTYNSNHIEGSRLSEEETRRIFETNTVGGDAHVDDIIETVNHFRAMDYCIDCAEEPLTEEIIKKLHELLSRGRLQGTSQYGGRRGNDSAAGGRSGDAEAP